MATPKAGEKYGWTCTLKPSWLLSVIVHYMSNLHLQQEIYSVPVLMRPSATFTTITTPSITLVNERKPQPK